MLHIYSPIGRGGRGTYATDFCATLLNRINKTRGKRHRLLQTRAAGILPSSTPPLYFTEMFLWESKHSSTLELSDSAKQVRCVDSEELDVIFNPPCHTCASHSFPIRGQVGPCSGSGILGRRGLGQGPTMPACTKSSPPTCLSIKFYWHPATPTIYRWHMAAFQRQLSS